ncbi:hypothetical protein ACFFMN_33180 [Planobispora siamensis]|uniref:Uncharacterized protein n=1 Tax=Planobispora siamensis TaxID=936338 RepID=A0A8J3SGG4_9ACTN|nr:hypothetical protein [Planobispora siamensis]GIH92580.1 hypothetical protein Psi01_32100 [Planobispora siamensis]
MQFIDVTELAGVRSVVSTFRRPGTPVRFVLYPMIHLGEAGFYAAVTEHLRSCDIVVVEGVDQRSAPVRALTASYRWLRGSDRLTLAVQHIDYESLGVRIVHPDMTREEFLDGWRRIPLRYRIAAYLLVPFFVAGMRLFGTRRFIARHLTKQETMSHHWGPLDEWDEGPFDELVLHRRDRLLTEALAALHEEEHLRPVTVGVLYGAGHMPAVADALWALGYRPVSAEWLTVFEFVSPEPVEPVEPVESGSPGPRDRDAGRKLSGGANFAGQAVRPHHRTPAVRRDRLLFRVPAEPGHPWWIPGTPRSEPPEERSWASSVSVKSPRSSCAPQSGSRSSSSPPTPW